MSNKLKAVSNATRGELTAAMEKHMEVMTKLYDEFGYGHKPAQFVGFLEGVTEPFALDMIKSIHEGIVRNVDLLVALRAGTVEQTVLEICAKIRDLQVPE